MGLSPADPAAADLGNSAAGAGLNPVAVAIATVFAFLAANNAWSPAPVRFAIRVLVAFLRTMPELAWAVIFVMAFGIGAIPGFLALMLHTVGSLTKLFYEAVESAQNKPVRGPGGLRRIPAAENSLRPVASGETSVSLLWLYAA